MDHWDRVWMDLDNGYQQLIGIVGIIILSAFLLEKWPRAAGGIGCLWWGYCIYQDPGLMYIILALVYGGTCLKATKERLQVIREERT